MPLREDSPFVQFINRTYNQFAADTVPLITAVYFTIKKLKDTSIEGLMDDWFKPAFTSLVLGTIIAVIIYCCLIKIITIWLSHIKVISQFKIKSSSFFHIIRKINLEIEEHISEIRSGGFKLDNFKGLLNYNANIGAIVTELHREIIEHFDNLQLKKHDVVVSLYSADDFPLPGIDCPEVEYCVHCDDSCGGIKTKSLSVEGETASFIGAKVLKNGSVEYLIDAPNGGFEVGYNERRKSIRQYMGIPITSRGKSIGVINIEIHNKTAFDDVSMMKSFYSEIAYGYKNQIEYQINKRDFFTLVNDSFSEKESPVPVSFAPSSSNS